VKRKSTPEKTDLRAMIKHWRWWFTLIVVTLVVGSPNPAVELERTADWDEVWVAGPVRAAVVPDFGVMHVRDGKIEGYDVQLLEMWSRSSGHPIHWTYVASVAEALEAVRSGQADVALGPIPSQALGDLQATVAVRRFTWVRVGPKGATMVPTGYPKPLWMLQADSLELEVAQSPMFRFAEPDSVGWLMPKYVAESFRKRGTPIAKGSMHWAVRPGDSLLTAELNDHLRSRKVKRTLGAWSRQDAPRRDTSLSRFDVQLLGHDGWDRATLTALIFTESRFNTGIVSPAGATGLMQLIPSTAERMNRGPVDLTDPVQNIRVGLRYLRYLSLFWHDRGVPPNERLPFVMASYNTGPAPVERAQKKAAKAGYDPLVWLGNVDQIARGPGSHYARKTAYLSRQYRGYSSALRQAARAAQASEAPKTESR
jgi:soluble lytic murein transglycosylase-like protein